MTGRNDPKMKQLVFSCCRCNPKASTESLFRLSGVKHYARFERALDVLVMEGKITGDADGWTAEEVTPQSTFTEDELDIISALLYRQDQPQPEPASTIALQRMTCLSAKYIREPVDALRDRVYIVGSDEGWSLPPVQEPKLGIEFISDSYQRASALRQRRAAHLHEVERDTMLITNIGSAKMSAWSVGCPRLDSAPLTQRVSSLLEKAKTEAWGSLFPEGLSVTEICRARSRGSDGGFLPAASQLFAKDVEAALADLGFRAELDEVGTARYGAFAR